MKRFDLPALLPVLMPFFAILLFSSLAFGQNKPTPAPAQPAANPPASKPFASPKADLKKNDGGIPPEVAKSVDNFFMLMRQDKVHQAFDEILANTKVKDREAEVADLKAKTVTLLLEFGKVLDYELVSGKRVGSRILILTYLSYSDGYPLRWSMTYYKPVDTWRLIDIRGDTSIRDLVDEAPNLVNGM